ncbi:hypothetical protein LINPERPRIM_LOCUS16790, partial [Linum perenne]
MAWLVDKTKSARGVEYWRTRFSLPHIHGELC